MPAPPKLWIARVVACVVLALPIGSFAPAAAVAEEDAAPAGDKATEAAQKEAAVSISPLATTGPKPAPITPPEPAQITAAIRRGVQFLLDDQNKDGSWGSAQKTKGLNIYAPPPGAHRAFRAAVTSLALMAFIEAEPGLAAEQRPAVAAAIERGEAWLIEHVGAVRRAADLQYVTPDALYNIWCHAYSIQALVRLHARAADDPEKQAKLKEVAAGQADLLRRYSFLAGGWGYYDMLVGTQIPSDASNSFCTATVLIALDEAKSIGVEFPKELIDKAMASMYRQLKPDFSYDYGEYLRMYPMLDINRPGGSLGRSQACNLALRLYGDKRVTDEVLKTWLDRLFARNGWLSIGRKRPIPHESFFQVAGYFYYYGHWYGAMCIEQLPTGERKHFQEHMAHILLPLQEKGGSWWDYPFYNYHQQYGTAMAVMTLLRCQADWGAGG